ncbi:actinodefensin-associated protein B [Spongiactinospora sp. 9N601]|uniref:actinodefensin-associated protein B n=1 Tax=Spongiactinospora sp. 9N601 TaxID=3375149 RepID=UPI0037B3A2AD
MNVRLADGIVFGTLPFCGVLVDTTTFRVVRVSARAGTALARLLDGDAAPDPFTDDLAARLTTAGLLRPAPGDGSA